MRRITLWALSTLTTLVLLFSYHTSTSSQGGGSPVVAQGPAAAGSADGSAGSSSDGSTGTSSSGSSAKAYDGGTAQTRWGPVQVRITVADGKIVSSEAVAYPNGNHEDAEINSYALPVLNQEAVQAQSADIDMVSGATVTSDGYVQSLQSAIDKANL